MSKYIKTEKFWIVISLLLSFIPVYSEIYKTISGDNVFSEDNIFFLVILSLFISVVPVSFVLVVFAITRRLVKDKKTKKVELKIK